MSAAGSDYARLCDELDELSDNPGSARFRELLAQLLDHAERGSIDAAEYSAELLAWDGPNHDAVAAYKWYFVALSSQGFLTEFSNLNGTPPYYRGAVGDFRNESMVSDLVAELGFAKVVELDKDIRQWLAEKRA
jgi:hypothetical protein